MAAKIAVDELGDHLWQGTYCSMTLGMTDHLRHYQSHVIGLQLCVVIIINIMCFNYMLHSLLPISRVYTSIISNQEVT